MMLKVKWGNWKQEVNNFFFPFVSYPGPENSQIRVVPEVWHAYSRELAPVPDQIRIHEGEISTFHVWGLLTDTCQTTFICGSMYIINNKAMSSLLINQIYYH